MRFNITVMHSANVTFPIFFLKEKNVNFSTRNDARVSGSKISFAAIERDAWRCTYSLYGLNSLVYSSMKNAIENCCIFWHNLNKNSMIVYWLYRKSSIETSMKFVFFSIYSFRVLDGTYSKNLYYHSAQNFKPFTLIQS